MNDAAKQFFDSLPSEKDAEPEYDLFSEPQPEKEQSQEEAQPETEPETAEEDTQEPERRKPLRSERRAEKQREYYEAQLREEREARIRAEERARTREEENKPDPDMLKLLKGGISEEEGVEIFNRLLTRTQEAAEERAFARFESREIQDEQEIDEIHGEIEGAIESIEDRYGVDLTDDTRTRNAFLDFAESIAPQDSDALPNMDSAWRLFQATRKAGPSQVERKQQIASRGMVRSTVNQAPGNSDSAKPMTFDRLSRGDWWDRFIKGEK